MAKPGCTPWSDLATQSLPQHCQAHGAFTSFRYGDSGPDWSNCPHCEADRAAATERSRRAGLFEQSGLRGRYRETTFATFDATAPAARRALDAAREFADQLDVRGGRAMVFVGPQGVGKSHLLAAIVHAVIDQRGISAVATTGAEIVRDVRATWGHGAERREQDVLNDYIRPDLLAIDEVALSMPSENERQIMFEVLDVRYQLQRPLLLATNLTAEELRVALGARIADRVFEKCRVVAMNLPSWRARGRRSGGGDAA